MLCKQQVAKKEKEKKNNVQILFVIIYTFYFLFIRFDSLKVIYSICNVYFILIVFFTFFGWVTFQTLDFTHNESISQIKLAKMSLINQMSMLFSTSNHLNVTICP